MPFDDDDDKAGQGDDNSQGKSAQSEITSLAEQTARQYKHATITFNHLLYALIKRNPQEFDNIMGPKIRSSQLLEMLERDMKNVADHPRDLKSPPDDDIKLGKKSGQVLTNAEVDSDRNWGSDRLFAAELLHAMIAAGKIENKGERSTTVTFI